MCGCNIVGSRHDEWCELVDINEILSPTGNRLR